MSCAQTAPFLFNVFLVPRPDIEVKEAWYRSKKKTNYKKKMTTGEDESEGYSPSARHSDPHRAATRGSALRGGTESGLDVLGRARELAVPPSWVQVCVCLCLCVCVCVCVYSTCTHVYAHIHP